MVSRTPSRSWSEYTRGDTSRRRWRRLSSTWSVWHERQQATEAPCVMMGVDVSSGPGNGLAMPQFSPIESVRRYPPWAILCKVSLSSCSCPPPGPAR
jgi:hypothetical protein